MVISFNGICLAKSLASKRLENMTFEVNRTQESGVFCLVSDDAIVLVIMPMDNAQ